MKARPFSITLLRGSSRAGGHSYPAAPGLASAGTKGYVYLFERDPPGWPVAIRWLTRLQEVLMTRREDDPFGPERRSFEEAKDDMESRFDEIVRNLESGRLPPLSRRSSRDFRGLSADFRVDILDHGDEVIVVAELPGAEEDAIQIRLLNPQTLRITARRAEPVEEESGGYYIRERGNGIMSRLIRLPASVTDESARTSFKNGVLEVRLQKMRGAPERGGKRITIE